MYHFNEEYGGAYMYDINKEYAWAEYDQYVQHAFKNTIIPDNFDIKVKKAGTNQTRQEKQQRKQLHYRFSTSIYPA